MTDHAPRDAPLHRPAPTAARVARAARLGLTRVWDPARTATVWGTRMRMPLSHDLPYFLRRRPDYSSNVGRLALAVVAAGRAPRFIDVGANIGDTAVILTRHVAGCSVLCLEADPHYFALLEANTRGLAGVTAVRTMVADEGGRTGQAISRVHGTGHVTTAAAGTDTTPTATLDAIVADHPAFADAGLLKTDTDGFDAAIVVGALPWITRAHPVVFLELDPQATDAVGAPVSPESALGALAGAGYGPALLWDNLGLPFGRLDVGDEAATADLCRFLRLRPDFYLDVAVFPRADAELAADLWAGEVARV